MNNFKRVFELEQHTPIIHFKPQEAGATLRATELKPKLDKFLLNKLGKQALQNYTTASHDTALDYKVHIQAQGKSDAYWNKNDLPAYFGNMGEHNEDKAGLLHTNGVRLEVRSFHKALLEAIEKHMPAFLALTNFGSRQNKGYGSYYIKPNTPHYAPVQNAWFDYYFTLQAKYYSSYKEVIEAVDLFHKVIRSGYNFPNRLYIKSILYSYFKEKHNIQWEKSAIKQHFFRNDCRAKGRPYAGLLSQQNKYNNADVLQGNAPNERDIRDLLGLSSTQSWYSYDSTINKEVNDVDRYKSPITYVPIMGQERHTVYISLEKENLMLNKLVKISSGKDNFNIKTPESFDIIQFFEYLRTVDISKRAQLHDQKGSATLRILENIFKEIKKA